MSENADILTTHDRAEAWLRRQGVQLKGEETDDLIIDVLLSGASRAVQNEIERNLKPVENDTTKTFIYDGSGFLSLSPFELRSLTSITLYSDLPVAQQQVLAAQSPTVESDYRLNPRDRNSLGCYDEITLPTIRRRWVNPLRQYEVKVVGDWGVDTVPGDIEWLVLEIVRLSYPTPLAPVTDEFGATLTNLSWLPRQLMEVLDAYRNPTV